METKEKLQQMKADLNTALAVIYAKLDILAKQDVIDMLTQNASPASKALLTSVGVVDAQVETNDVNRTA